MTDQPQPPIPESRRLVSYGLIALLGVWFTVRGYDGVRADDASWLDWLSLILGASAVVVCLAEMARPYLLRALGKSDDDGRS